MPRDLPAALPDLPDLVVCETAVTVSVLRVRDHEAAAVRLGEAFAMPWPTTPNLVFGEAPRVAWLAPGEWSIFAPAEDLAARIGEACAGLTHHLVDVSAGRRRWRIEGVLARDLLAKGCSLDTDPRVFGPGQCAQSLLAQVLVLLTPLPSASGGAAFDLVADVSLAGHLRAWLADAALEFQR